MVMVNEGRILFLCCSKWVVLLSPVFSLMSHYYCLVYQHESLRPVTQSHFAPPDFYRRARHDHFHQSSDHHPPRLQAPNSKAASKSLRRRAMASPSPSSPLHQHQHQHQLPPNAHPQFQAPLPSMPLAAPPKALDLEVTVVSGKHLKNVNWRRGDLRAYVVAYLDPSRRAATRPDDAGGCKPVWSERLVLPLPPHLSPHDPSILLSLDVFHSKPSDSPKPLVGSARSPLRDLLFPTNPNPSHDSPSSPLVTLPLLRPSGRPQGKLRIRVSIRERSPPPPEPQYPPPSSSPYYFPPPSAYSAPPQYVSDQYYRPSGYYSAPPPPQYEYSGGPSAPVEYSRQYEQRGSGRYGVGTGLAVGAVAGALGGLAVEEGVKYKEEKAAERVEEKVAPAGRGDYSEYRGDY
ncbi:extensin-like isoform X2 [Phragmites australis]|uniref:extensin-like isoform X2 n=1 Tax=Phragmites australis TaxID=29695 RepID=UPI002D76E80B|nr:extensin-like isoform X2 [Phragmites australis]